MATEIEMKLSVPDLETLNWVLSDPELMQYAKDDIQVRRMRSTYYDTPDGSLHRQKWTLRLRDEGGHRVAAFKTANRTDETGFFTRNEWQCEVDNVQDAIPILIDQGAPRGLKSMLKGKDLIETCGADFERHSVCLYMDGGVRLEMAGDYGILFSGESKMTICELELELLYGDAASLPPLCAQLEADYGLVPESRSKYERAHSLTEA